MSKRFDFNENPPLVPYQTSDYLKRIFDDDLALLMTVIRNSIKFIG